MSILSVLFPKPAPFQAKSVAYDLKSRLDWGAPALTIIDVRDRAEFNAGHIMGAISMPKAELVMRASASLDRDRDIYLYGESDEETATAAAQLRAAGFKNVSELQGGLAAWQGASYPVETSLTAAV